MSWGELYGIAVPITAMDCRNDLLRSCAWKFCAVSSQRRQFLARSEVLTEVVQRISLPPSSGFLGLPRSWRHRDRPKRLQLPIYTSVCTWITGPLVDFFFWPSLNKSDVITLKIAFVHVRLSYSYRIVFIQRVCSQHEHSEKQAYTLLRKESYFIRNF